MLQFVLVTVATVAGSIVTPSAGIPVHSWLLPCISFTFPDSSQVPMFTPRTLWVHEVRHWVNYFTQEYNTMTCVGLKTRPLGLPDQVVQSWIKITQG